MMVRLLPRMLVAWLVVGCAPEEPDTAGVLSVDSNSETEVPDGLTAAYLDLNKDGTIDIKDLVIMSKFFGQDVPEADAVAEVSESTSESSPCGDMEFDPFEPASQFDNMTVMDNANYRKIFNVEEKKYVYALLVVTKIYGRASPEKVRADYQNLSETQKETLKLKLEEAEKPACIAVRFLISDDLLPVEAKIKVITGFEYPNVVNSTLVRLMEVKTNCWPNLCDRLIFDEGNRDGFGYSVEVNRKFNFSRGGHGQSEYGMTWPEVMKRVSQMGIPIGNDSVIRKLYMLAPPVSSEFSKYFDDRNRWYIFRIYNKRSPNPLIWHAEHSDHVDEGIYVNMLPDEVQQRYFPEDIQ